MAKMMTQIDLLTKHVMNGEFKSVNAVDTRVGKVSNDANFDAMYNEEVQYLMN